MNQFVPKLFDCMKGYSKEQFVKDVIAGIIVAIIALPLSIALALASGVGPEQGIYTAIFAGFVISFLGGSRVQIAGPTAAFATIVAGIVAEHQMEGLVVATVMAGILLIIMGLLKFGNLIRFIPYTITSGFTFGIAVTIVIGQVKDFLGLTFTYSPVETIDSGAGINCRTGIPCDSDCVSKGHGKNSTVIDCSYRSNFNGKAASHECKDDWRFVYNIQ